MESAKKSFMMPKFLGGCVNVMDLYRLKLVHKHFNTGKLYDDCPLETSIELTNTEDKPIGLIEQLYYNGKTKKIDKKQIKYECKGVDKIFEKVKLLELNNLKNNYYTEEIPQCYSSWTIEYNTFKIMGTYDNEIDEFKELSKILNFKRIISNMQDK